MQANLSWPQARSLAESGSIVRRKWWLARSIFATAGNLKWMQWGVKRVALSTDFTVVDHDALDWTDAPPEKSHCVGIGLVGAIAFSAASVTDTASATALLSVPEPLDEDVTFTLSSDIGFVSFPATVTIPQGSLSVSFTVTGIGGAESGAVNLIASSTYISASGSIRYLYVPPPPPPLPVQRFVINTIYPSELLYWNVPVARITNGPSPANVWIEGTVDDDVTFDGLVYEADQHPFPDYHYPGHQNGRHYFNRGFYLAAGQSVDIGMINNGGPNGIWATVELTFTGYDGRATFELL